MQAKNLWATEVFVQKAIDQDFDIELIWDYACTLL